MTYGIMVLPIPAHIRNLLELVCRKMKLITGMLPTPAAI